MPTSRLCAFCGSKGPLSREHIFGQWLARLGIVDGTVENFAGLLNRRVAPMGRSAPFDATVKSICASCNNGWMSELEEVAKRVLTPLVMGLAEGVPEDDGEGVARWLQKTALVAMLRSTAEQRELGHGLPQSEYAELFASRVAGTALPSSLFWTGRYSGRFSAGFVQVTPVALYAKGLPEPPLPQGYAITVVVGSLVLHALRWTESVPNIEVKSNAPLVGFWPTVHQEGFEGQTIFDDAEMLELARGRLFSVNDLPLKIRPYSPASDLEASELEGEVVLLPALCGQHTLGYPVALVHEALRGRYHWFVARCECEESYLIHTEADGAHVKAAGTDEQMWALFRDMRGIELTISDAAGGLLVKSDT